MVLFKAKKKSIDLNRYILYRAHCSGKGIESLIFYFDKGSRSWADWSSSIYGQLVLFEQMNFKLKMIIVCLSLHPLPIWCSTGRICLGASTSCAGPVSPMSHMISHILALCIRTIVGFTTHNVDAAFFSNHLNYFYYFFPSQRSCPQVLFSITVMSWVECSIDS